MTKTGKEAFTAIRQMAHAWWHGEERSKTLLWRGATLLYDRAPRIGDKLLARKLGDKFHDPPVIIAGCGRSGTTLLASILSAHPAIFVIPRETRVFSPTGYDEAPNPDAPFDINKINCYFLLNHIPKSCTRWCEKTPRNILYIERILEHFDGNVRIIHMVRDGRDVVLSRHALNTSGYWVDPTRWVQDVTAGLAFDDRPQVLLVKYESLVSDYEATIRRICDHVGEACVDEILNWHGHARLRSNIAWQKGIQRLNTKSVGKFWDPKHHQRTAAFMKEPGSLALLERLGYPIDNEGSKS
jgi:hypothetical protein